MSRYTFTLFGYKKKDYERVCQIGDRIIFQEERCPSSGRTHMQGYVEFDNAVEWEVVKLLFGNECHLEDAYKDQKSNIIYCSKQRTRIGRSFNRGFTVPSGRGRRNDLEIIHDKLRGGASLQSISDEHFGDFIRYSTGFAKYKFLHAPKRTWKTKVVVYWGPTGCGKTHKAWAEYPDLYEMPIQHGDKLWFEGYNGEPTVLWDEFYGQCRWPLLLKMCDKRALKVPVLYGYVQFIPTTLIFTSNVHPRDWYDFEANFWMKYEALERRIDEIEELTTYYVEELN